MNTSTTGVTGTGTNTPTYTGATGTNAGGTAKANGGTLTMDDFLNLLVTQLKNQDPTNPTSDTQFAGEMAQFSSLQAATDTNSTLSSYSQTSSLGTAAGLIGATVTSVTTDATGNSTSVTGQVTGATLTKGTVYVMVNGSQVPLSSLTSVTPSSSSSSS